MNVIHRFPQLIRGKLLKRYKRFLCDVELESGNVVVCYLANPGSMLGMCVFESPVRLSIHDSNSKRKHPYTVEAIKIGKVWIGCNTMLANKVVHRILINRNLEMGEYSHVKPEWKSGDSRFDFALFNESEEIVKVIEVKTVTMSSDWFDIETTTTSAREKLRKIPADRPSECTLKSVALFPDSESTRAKKHLEHLARLDKNCCLIYFISRGDVRSVAPSFACDPAYSATFNEVCRSGIIKLISLFVDFQVEDVNDARLVLLKKG